MTLAVYVLDVPEFEPVVHTAEAAGMAVRRTGDYLELSTTEQEIVLRREETGMRTALWHALLTGGLDGRIVSFTPDTLHLVQEAA
ncbi:hypothetical protein NCG97_08870 [Streptomyces lydicamycinicus]|uniref:Uncharacterized protein n=1 Tax=Streptomyces lydicamycinicus TaxID=1546107 RepID=A0A0P4RE58_9ACTN|nr:hypothetical protein [Streptomyces lydicamycinicus]USA00784.1 hypothetical protein NCG97_08870 [Streptomyces lydicamycinicus]GAO11400.1 hypothetical protein TPA0598_08_03110 [Streptomyces lydicamycinicus]